MKHATAHFTGEPRWVTMWLLVALLVLVGKMAVWRVATARPVGWCGLGWWLLWPGMDAERFALVPSSGAPASAVPDLRSAFTNIALGACLLWVVARRCPGPLQAGWAGMVGMILITHFGLMHLLCRFWRRRGVVAGALMKNPAASLTLAEFWGRRWNAAFRDLAHRVVFRPVAARWGRVAGLWVSFTVSGLAHEVVISIPAGGGFGLPTLYFLLQALGMTLERKLSKRRAPLVKWLFTHGFTILPLGFLFHPPFVRQVMLPFFHAIGALP